MCVCAIYAVLCDCVERMHMLFSCVCYYWALLFASFDEMIYTFMYARARIKSSHWCDPWVFHVKTYLCVLCICLHSHFAPCTWKGGFILLILYACCKLPVRVHHIYACYVLRFCCLVSSHLTALCIFEPNMCDTTIICVCICIYVYIFCLYT